MIDSEIGKMTNTAEIKKKQCSVKEKNSISRALHLCEIQRKSKLSPQEWELKTDRCGLGRGSPFENNPLMSSHRRGCFPGVFSGRLCSSVSFHSCQPYTQTWHLPGKSPGAAQNYKTTRNGKQGEEMVKTNYKLQTSNYKLLTSRLAFVMHAPQ